VEGCDADGSNRSGDTYEHDVEVEGCGTDIDLSSTDAHVVDENSPSGSEYGMDVDVSSIDLDR
jgi:hypothetical protein